MLNRFRNSNNNRGGKENGSFKITAIKAINRRPPRFVLGNVDSNNAANLETYATNNGKVVSVKSSMNNSFNEEDAIEIDFKKYQVDNISFEDQLKNVLIRLASVETENEGLKTRVSNLEAENIQDAMKIDSIQAELKVVKQVVGHDISIKLAEAKMTLKHMVKTNENNDAIYKLKAYIEAMESNIFHHVLTGNN